jgi:multiple sugar transport system permease protein
VSTQTPERPAPAAPTPDDEARARRARRRARDAGLRREQFLLLIPALLPIVLFSVYPLLRGIFLGFTNAELGEPGLQVTWFENYVELFRDTDFQRSLQTGLIWSVAVTGLQLVLAMGLALLLTGRFRLRWVARILVLVPWAMPEIIKGAMWRILYHPEAGLINDLLVSAGVLSSSTNILLDFTWALPAIILVGVWSGMPQTTVMLLAGLQTVPGELREAASLDGAGPWNQFRYVILPAIRPVLIAVVSLDFIWNFNSFGLVYVLTEGGPGGRTRLPMLLAYEEAFSYGNLGYAAALGNVMVLIIALMLFVYIRNGLRRTA